MAYPVTFDIQPPERFQKPQVAIRLLVMIILALLAGSIGWLFGAMYLILPVAAALLVSQKGAERYLAESEADVTRWTRYVIAIYAYMAFLTDRFINEDPEQTMEFRVRTGGSPTAGSALLRVIYGIPHAFVLGLLSLAFIVVIPVSIASILFTETVPDWAYSFTRGWLRWYARLLAYMASLTDEYPPFSFENGEVAAPVEPSPAPPAPSSSPQP